MLSHADVVVPTWPAPPNVSALTTTVFGGVSQGAYQRLNLAKHVGDEAKCVRDNRARLQHYLGKAVKLCWLNQTHSDVVVDLQNTGGEGGVLSADGAVSRVAHVACVVMTADCLPVLLCDEQGTTVAALHCGWRGLYDNLMGKTIRQHFADKTVLAWLGPAIGQVSYEVDEHLYRRFLEKDEAYGEAFRAHRPGHYLFDLYTVAKKQLRGEGVAVGNCYGGDFDTFAEPRFFSYRRAPQTGRMASIIYLS